MRQQPYLRKNALERPQMGQRLYARTLNFGLRWAFTLRLVLAKPVSSYFLNGMPRRSSKSLPSLSVLAVVEIVMFMPLTISTLSISSSKKIVCSLIPMVKLPRPSKPRSGTPRKSRTRGRAKDHQLVVEVPHGVAAQGHAAANRLAFTQLESRDGLLGAGDHRLLTGDLGQLNNGFVDELGILAGFAQTDVQRDLLNTGDLHAALVAELFLEFRNHPVVVYFFKPSHGATY